MRNIKARFFFLEIIQNCVKFVDKWKELLNFSKWINLNWEKIVIVMASTKTAINHQANINLMTNYYVSNKPKIWCIYMSCVFERACARTRVWWCFSSRAIEIVVRRTMSLGCASSIYTTTWIRRCSELYWVHTQWQNTGLNALRILFFPLSLSLSLSLHSSVRSFVRSFGSALIVNPLCYFKFRIVCIYHHALHAYFYFIRSLAPSILMEFHPTLSICM